MENKPEDLHLSPIDARELDYFKSIVKTEATAAAVDMDYKFLPAYNKYRICRMDRFGTAAINEFHFTAEAGVKAAVEHAKNLLSV